MKRTCCGLNENGQYYEKIKTTKIVNIKLMKSKLQEDGDEDDKRNEEHIMMYRR